MLFSVVSIISNRVTGFVFQLGFVTVLGCCAGLLCNNDDKLSLAVVTAMS